MFKVLVIKSNETDTFCCNVCGGSVTGKMNYVKHMSTHRRDEILSVTYVVKPPSDEEAFRGPIAEYRDEGQKTCTVCLKVLKSFSSLEEHMRTHTGERPFSCSICGKRFTRKDHVKGHEARHHNDHDKKPLTCDICQKTFARKGNLTSHLKYVHKVEKRKPVEEKKYIPVQKHLEKEVGTEVEKRTVKEEKHVRLHVEKQTEKQVEEIQKDVKTQNEKPAGKEEEQVKLLDVEKQTEKQVEDEVKKEDDTQNKKQEKEIIKQGPKKVYNYYYKDEGKLYCSVGSETFKLELALKDDTEVCTDEKSFSWSSCHAKNKETVKTIKPFSYSDYLKQVGKPDERKFVCGICDVTFFRKHQLLGHMKIHSGEVLCQICDKIFSSKVLLTGHMELHKQRKHHDIDSVGRYRTFTCTHCDAVYLCKNNLKAHMRVHTDEGVYSCNVCHKFFQHRSTLSTHMRQKKHTDVVNNSCRICSKKFLRTSCLNSHMQIHTSRKTFQCCFCHKELKKSWKLFDGKGFDARICTVCKQISLGCDLCNEVVEISSLRTHLGQHTGEF